ncbi:MAG: SAM-dependent methyltransferase [Emcibacteraceae bacterium]
MTQPEKSALKDHLIKLIKLHGPISVSTYMSEALTNPHHGYYVKRNPFGKSGDFITAPEISQMFGEMIGLWFADLWLKMDRPFRVHLIELGPGRGTLMADLIRVLDVLPDFKKAVEIHLVEASPDLKEVQQDKLYRFPGKITWHDTVKSALDAAAVDDEATFLIANEFFDALPIRQFQKGELGWHERMVTVNEKDDGLTTMLSPFPLEDLILPEAVKDAELHSIIEVSPMADYITRLIADHISACSGAALFIDYGYTDYRTGETLQAVKDHKYTFIYDEPGWADLSAHVNFRKMADIIGQTGLKTLGPVSQGDFLNNMGIGERAALLSEKADGEKRETIMGELDRLTSPNEMGKLFKVLGIISDKKIETAGF